MTYRMPNSTQGWVRDMAESVLLDANHYYTKLLQGVLVLTAFIALSLMVNTMSMQGPGLYNYCLLAIGLFIIIAFGFMPLVLIVTAIIGGVSEVAKDGEDEGFMRGATNGVSTWLRYVVGAIILGYLILMFDLAITPYRGHPTDFLKFTSILLILLVVFAAFGSKMSKNIRRLLLAIGVIFLFWSHWHVVPNGIADTVECTFGSSSCNGTIDTTTTATTNCSAIVDDVISSAKWSKPFKIGNPQCGVLGWARDDDSAGVLKMMANGDERTIRTFRRGQVPNYPFPVVSIQFKLVDGPPVYVATGSRKAVDQLRETYIASSSP